MAGLRSALWLPIFDDLADPLVVARLAADAEEAGWHGVFVWDHVRWREPVRQVADPWITLAAIAMATERVRLGPMITPLARPVQRPGRALRYWAHVRPGAGRGRAPDSTRRPVRRRGAAAQRPVPRRRPRPAR